MFLLRRLQQGRRLVWSRQDRRGTEELDAVRLRPTPHKFELYFDC